MHQDFSVYTKETLCTADLLEAVHQYSMQDIHGSAHTSNFTSLSTREGQFHNLNTLPPQSEVTTQSTTTNANETVGMMTHAVLLGRGPHKNCKNDLDDQT